MKYTETFNSLKEKFSQNTTTILENGNGLFRFIPFTSLSNYIISPHKNDLSKSMGHSYAAEDNAISENQNFSIHVYLPENNVNYRKAIILLHGLNERSWNKYLPWAQYLGQKTKRPVIMFPIAFHMNRGHESWTKPRVMMPLLNNRKAINGLNMATFANIALSQRLSEDPLRFFTSGKQSAEDLIKLILMIQEGSIEFLEKDSHVDFFSYSIGSFLAQIMFIANPKKLFNRSKLYVFCGGSLFSDMKGTSRLIMDSHAYHSLHSYYLNTFQKELKNNPDISQMVKEGELGEAFLTMIREDNNRNFRVNRFEQLRDQIRVVSLKRDMVIPSRAIHENASPSKNKSRDMVTELEFPFEYSHENPFPIIPGPRSVEVDRAFNIVFARASEFLC